MRAPWRATLLIVGLLTSWPTQSQQPRTQTQSEDVLEDGNKLLNDCTTALRLLAEGASAASGNALWRANYCSGYIDGFLDGHALTAAINGGRKLYCLPLRGISAEQATRIFVKYLQDHPEKLHDSGRILVLIAFETAFPCK